MHFGGHLEKFWGQNPRNSKKQRGHGKPIKGLKSTLPTSLKALEGLTPREWYCLSGLRSLCVLGNSLFSVIRQICIEVFTRQ